MNPFVHLNFWTLYICTFRIFLGNLLGIFVWFVFFYCLFGVVWFGFILWVFLLVLSLYWTSVWCPSGMSTLRLEPCGLGRFSLHSRDSLTILPTRVPNAVALSLPRALGGTEGKNQPQQWGMWRVPGEVEGLSLDFQALPSVNTGWRLQLLASKHTPEPSACKGSLPFAIVSSFQLLKGHLLALSWASTVLLKYFHI